MATHQAMRPLERRIHHLDATGVDHAEIARRFKRSPEAVGRILQWIDLPGRSGTSSERGGMRAVERRVLRWRSRGLGHEEIARRFKRSPRSIRQIEGLALYKQSRRLLRSP